MHIRIPTVAFVAFTVLLSAACAGAAPGSQPSGGEASTSATPTVVTPERYALQQSLDFTITLTTTSVGGNFGRLDRKHSCERGDTSPHLRWEGVPEGAESLALVVEDPASDVFGLTVDVLWAHWVVYSIPPDVTELDPGQAAGELLGNGSKQGVNDYELVQYNGPCPIPTLKRTGIEWRRDTAADTPNINAEERPYNFRLYALDIPVDLPSGADRDTLLQAIDGHILAVGELPINYKSTKGISCQSPDPDVCVKSSVKR